MIVALPTIMLPHAFLLGILRGYARSSLWLLRAICGVKVEWRGLEKLPPGACLVACKHQSLWETFALFALLPDPAYILKRELMWIPLFGWLARKAGMISVDRRAHANALARMTAATHKEIARSRQIVIFPEGTRRPPGAKPRDCPASLSSTPRPACPAFRWRSIPDCSGRAVHCGDLPHRLLGARTDPARPRPTGIHGAPARCLGRASARLVAEGQRSVTG